MAAQTLATRALPPRSVTRRAVVMTSRAQVSAVNSIGEGAKSSVPSVFSLAASPCVSPARTYPFSKTLATDVTMAWTCDTGNFKLLMSLCMPTTGWVAVGFGSNTMTGADVLIGHVAPVCSGAEPGCVFDTETLGQGAAVLDTAAGGTNDVTLVCSSEMGGFTTLEFDRPFAATDAYDAPVATGGAGTDMIWGFGPDDLDGDGRGGSQHAGTNRGGFTGVVFCPNALYWRHRP